ncbi:hypothetical protein D1227_06345 [Henriciella mobilis]|uniref:hypothetical protein n=1 Tax=Henriciella mobilis TaxID=2305467 RepID=UPI000E660FE9|nr:hypothetical protein [Henriciella mobilis]RIJ15969.1 hypothetical protein D1231_09255 [Henriciella mobilis]RIJ21179.1 hypothetical protein D1227_12795 [Henriciella mobilis]RIJ23120.1 hypothetical protein D1227_06345 [Henriciella mobilis]
MSDNPTLKAIHTPVEGTRARVRSRLEGVEPKIKAALALSGLPPKYPDWYLDAVSLMNMLDPWSRLYAVQLAETSWTMNAYDAAYHVLQKKNGGEFRF